MKKQIVLILALALCCLLLPAAAEGFSPVGTWHLTEMRNTEGNSVYIYEESPDNMTMEILEDGTYSVTMFSSGGDPEITGGTWTFSGNALALSGEEEVFTFENGTLSVPVGTGTLVFSPEKNVLSLPSAMPADSSEAFDGTWYVRYSYSDGMLNPYTSDLSERAFIRIENGRITEYAPGEDGTYTEVNAYELAFSDGFLAASLSRTDPGSGAVYSIELTGSLREDGTFLLDIAGVYLGNVFSEINMVYFRAE